MLCPDCDWMWEWEENPTPYCPFCGSVGSIDNNAPPEAEAAVQQASGDIFEGGRAAKL